MALCEIQWVNASGANNCLTEQKNTLHPWLNGSDLLVFA